MYSTDHEHSIVSAKLSFSTFRNSRFKCASQLRAKTYYMLNTCLRIYTVHGQCTYSARPMHVQFMANACTAWTVHAQCMCIVHVQCKANACRVHGQCMYRTWPMHVLHGPCMPNACIVYMQCMADVCAVHVQCKANACTVHGQCMCSA